MRWPKNIMLSLAIVSVVLAVIVNLPIWYDSHVILPDGTSIDVEVADSAEERRVGLSGHAWLDADRGMLFLFDEPGRYGFWMKDMDFPIDIIWLRGETIVNVTPDVPVPDGDDLPQYLPNTAVDGVLEVNAGFAQAHGLVAGDLLDIDLP
ncbi:hypothetical protein A2348_02830 [Candidatus Uhrbacteria bacterium RIFOXYB12_FULL_58_10]|nr:MAG: hypothetical protein A2348_02830 [Candidatus Uhrbacteria bacterium RIFOXYB12_FULL_58_10]OGL99230.1 MAG: hypothetical protein A2501_03475 [Candidatus Uhrbacteria bacterium RIFOXYC12_FULL_57_11]